MGKRKIALNSASPTEQSLQNLKRGAGFLATQEAFDRGIHQMGQQALAKKRAERRSVIEFMEWWFWQDREVLDETGKYRKIPVIQALLEKAGGSDKKAAEILRLYTEYTEEKKKQKVEVSGKLDTGPAMTDEQRTKLYELIKTGKLG